MMIWWVKLAVIWLSIDLVIITIGWYALAVIKPRHPEWWRRVIADYDPQDDFYKRMRQ
jgi:hypothetical protein